MTTTKVLHQCTEGIHFGGGGIERRDTKLNRTDEQYKQNLLVSCIRNGHRLASDCSRSSCPLEVLLHLGWIANLIKGHFMAQETILQPFSSL